MTPPHDANMSTLESSSSGLYWYFMHLRNLAIDWHDACSSIHNRRKPLFKCKPHFVFISRSKNV
jgi:hypothetical protein